MTAIKDKRIKKKVLKPKRQGDYGKNKGKTYKLKSKQQITPAPSADPDEFDINKINNILEEHQRKLNLKDPEKEKAKAKAAEDTDYIKIDNDPDEDPDKDPEKKDPKPEDPKPEDPDIEDPYSLKDILNPDLVIDGLQWLSFKGAEIACKRTGKIPMNQAACKYSAKERELMRPGAEKLLDKLKLKQLEDKPITALLAVAVIHTIAIVAMSSKKPVDPQV